jgi:ADP-ribosylglycohydrolase
MSALGLRDLGDVVELLGMDWYHVPIADFGVPDATAEARWRHSSLRLRRDLSRGGAVVFHCKGGLGRTGTLAARFLIDMGEEPEAAVAQVRRARPGAIETKEQLAYVLGRTAGGALPEPPTLEERIFGCLLGGAVGDAFGYPIEFEKLRTIQSRFGRAGLCEPILEGSRLLVSDDTQMTMFTAEGLIRAYERMRDRGIVSTETVVWRAYKRWLQTQGFQSPAGELDGEPGWLIGEPSLHEPRAPGNTCISALRARSAHDGAPANNNSKGCGGVMRVAPAGLLPAFFDTRSAFELATKLATLTHGHPTGYLAAGALAAIVRNLLDGASHEASTAGALEFLSEDRAGEETAGAIEHALALASKPSRDPAEDVARLGQGWTAEEALAIGLYAAMRSYNFREVVCIAANHDGDSDSTASIAGQIYGAANGVAGVPNAWIRRLDVLDPLLTLAADLASLSTPEKLLLRTYPPN